MTTVLEAQDISRSRERARQRRLGRMVAISGPVLALVLAAEVAEGMGHPLIPAAVTSYPRYVALSILAEPTSLIMVIFLLVMIATTVAMLRVGGSSTHVVYRPEQLTVGFNDVVGLGPVKHEVVRSLDLFRGAQTFRTTMGGTARRGLLFEGSPGTGKTLMAKALAREAGVPFLYLSATSIQSQFYGASARKIRSYFKELRKAARAEGGAIGFIEEIDAIAMSRGGVSAMAPAVSASEISCCGGLSGLPGAQVTAAAPIVNSASMHEGIGGVVNELLVQMQSFDEPTGMQKFLGRMTDGVNLLLPSSIQIPRQRPENLNILLIAATNRADSLDPALLRPGRFDRRLTFDLPDHKGRREIVDYYLSKKSHDEDLATDERRDALAGVTQGYSPVRIENLLDEALISALRRGADAMNWNDVEKARMLVELGVGNPVDYTLHEQRVIATHEAGHATVAFLEAPYRRLEILSIVKRANALGLLAHGDTEDVYTRSRTELTALIRIAMGGQTAEEQFFGDVTTGPASDLQFATTTAATMVGAAGMSDTLVSLAAANGALQDNLVGRVLGDKASRDMLERLLQEQKDYVRRLLGANADLVEALRDALLERHELIGHEITDVLHEALARREGTESPTDEEHHVIDLTALEKGLESIKVSDDEAAQEPIRLDEAVELPQREH